MLGQTQLSIKLLGAALLLSLLSVACKSEPTTQVSGPPPVPVKLKVLETATLITSGEYVGTLEATQRVNLAPRISGRILEIMVEQGETITQGQPLVKLEPTQQKEQVNAATSQVSVEQARLGQSQAELQAAQADRARAAADVERARAEIEDTKAGLALAQINYERSDFLVAQGVNARQDLDEKTKDLESNRARLSAREKSLLATQEALSVADKRVKQALANVEAQRAAVTRAQADLGAIGEELNFNTIVAPISGIIGDFEARKIGDVVNTGDVLTTITNNQLFDLRVNIPIEYRSQLRLGLPVDLIDDNGDREVSGQVTYIAPLVDQPTQSVLTKLTFASSSGNLRDRQFVRARVIWDEQPGVLVPTVAVTRLGGQQFVFVAQEQQQETGESALVARQTPVTVAGIQDQGYQVLSGVQAGDRVVISRILDLRDGRPIVEEALTSQRRSSVARP
ncbi:MAG: efflux RND transporter periplasmic adaptor subunit [Chloroflexaceae bacterium]|nr:efflux RND transporter periplasmic adaptor subunit [Chloroflexaceae bacterium]